MEIIKLCLFKIVKLEINVRDYYKTKQNQTLLCAYFETKSDPNSIYNVINIYCENNNYTRAIQLYEKHSKVRVVILIIFLFNINTIFQIFEKNDKNEALKGMIDYLKPANNTRQIQTPSQFTITPEDIKLIKFSKSVFFKLLKLFPIIKGR